MRLRDKQLEMVKQKLISDCESTLAESKRLLAALDAGYKKRGTRLSDTEQAERKQIEANAKTFQTKIDALKKGLTPTQPVKNRQGYVRRTV